MKYFVILLFLIGFVGTSHGFEPSMNQAPLSYFGYFDNHGDKVTTLVIGEEYLIKAKFFWSESYSQPYEFFAEINDDKNHKVIERLSVQGTMTPNNELEIEFSWTPKETGEFRNFSELWATNKPSVITGVPQYDFKVMVSSPRKQIQSGIIADHIQCNVGLVLTQRIDGSPACVTEQTKTKLVERGWTKDDSTLSKINTSCMTLEQSKETAPFFKTPSYLPEGYSYVCSRSGMPFESYIVYYNQEFPTNWQIPELVSDGAIFIYQVDEKNMVGDKEFQTYGSPEQRARETYDDVMKNNPSLNPQLITINGMLAYAVDSCPDCGMQTANFTDGTSIQKSTSTETRIKFIDENGVSYMLKTTLPLQELIKVAESLQ